MQPSFTSNYTFQKKIDNLPIGPAWTCEMVEVKGDRIGPDGKVVTERLELWRRNPIDCIRDLIGNPSFHKHVAYGPEHIYVDDKAESRIFDEMWTGDWWWQTQVRVIGTWPKNKRIDVYHIGTASIRRRGCTCNPGFG